MSRIRLHIDRLVVTGLGAPDRRGLVAAFSQELARLLERTRPSAAGSEGRIEARPIALSPAAPARVVGNAVARAVHGALPGIGKGGPHG